MTGPETPTSTPRPVAVGCNPTRRTSEPPDTPWGRLRRRTGWSLREMEQATGINRGDLSKFERGRGCPTPEQAGLILRAFEATR